MIPDKYLKEATSIPDFWITKSKEVYKFLHQIVKKGKIEIIGKSAGNCPVVGVFYGKARKVDESTTYNGAIAARSIDCFTGKDSDKKVYMAVAGVHGSEFEGIVGIVNLISILETGRDLTKRKWPQINKMMQAMDRIVLIPILNVDGRNRIPISMFPFFGENSYGNNSVYQFWGTGAWKNNNNIGWPDCKKYIPLDFKKTSFPGGYPNGNGVNIQHDDFFLERKQPETKIIMDIARREKANIILNMHTGVDKENCLPFMIHPFMGHDDSKRVGTFIKRSQKKLIHTVFSKDEISEFDFREHFDTFNLNSAVYFNSGSKMITVESPCHALLGKINGQPIRYTPENLIYIQMNAHKVAMKFVLQSKA